VSIRLEKFDAMMAQPIVALFEERILGHPANVGWMLVREPIESMCCDTLTRTVRPPRWRSS